VFFAMQPRLKDTPVQRKPAKVARYRVQSKSHSPQNPNPIQRRRILDLSKRALPPADIASQAGTGQQRVLQTIAGGIEFNERLPARLRLMLPVEVAQAVMQVVERLLADCERECFEEREVA
jgi:hypothetical protein